MIPQSIIAVTALREQDILPFLRSARDIPNLRRWYLSCISTCIFICNFLIFLHFLYFPLSPGSRLTFRSYVMLSYVPENRKFIFQTTIEQPTWEHSKYQIVPHQYLISMLFSSSTERYLSSGLHTHLLSSLLVDTFTYVLLTPASFIPAIVSLRSLRQ